MSTCMSTSRSNYFDMSIWKKHADHSTNDNLLQNKIYRRAHYSSGPVFSGTFCTCALLIFSIFDCLLFFSQWVCIPFAMTYPSVAPIESTSDQWIGTWDSTFAGQWMDYALLLVRNQGCIVWNLHSPWGRFKICLPQVEGVFQID